MQLTVKRQQQKLQKLHSCNCSEQMPKHQTNWELNRCYSDRGKPGKHLKNISNRLPSNSLLKYIFTHLASILKSIPKLVKAKGKGSVVVQEQHCYGCGCQTRAPAQFSLSKPANAAMQTSLAQSIFCT